MIWCLAAAFVIIAALAIKIYLLKKTAREIKEQVSEKLMQDTNTSICISSVDRDMRELASELNNTLGLLRAEYIRYNKGDAELKTAVTNISHDLRTPIAAIYGYLDFLKQEEKSEKAEEYLEIISGRTEALKQLTEELLKYSSAVSSQEQLELEDAVINSILEESILSYYAVMQEHGITPNINITEKRVICKVDKKALARVYANLLNNAMKYSKGDLTITLTDDGTTEFSNRTDSLDKLQVEKLFDRFYTVENGKSSSGLGLSIAKFFIEQMNGTISADYVDDILKITIKL